MAKTQFTTKKQHISPKRLLGLVVALVVVFLLGVSVVTVAQKYFVIKKDIRELTLEQKTLQEKKESLTKVNEYLATPEGAEQTLREKYNVVKPGEGIVVVVTKDTVVPIERKSRVEQWWEAILKGIGIQKE